jgi:hypothetical protein
VLLDHDDYLPRYVLITEARCSDVRVAQSLDLNPGSIVAMDRGYNDYSLFARWTDRQIGFVTRLKENAVYEVVNRATGPLPANILADQLIRFTGDRATQDCPHTLRRVVVWDKRQEREIVLLTNLLYLSAATIAAIYKDRWEIETYASHCTSFGRSDSSGRNGCLSGSSSLWFLTGGFGPGSSNKHPPLSLYA